MSEAAPTVTNQPEQSRFALLDGSTVIGSAHYVPFSSGGAGADVDQRIFYHTVVDESRAGQGLASRLAGQALDETVAAGLSIVPVCPYIKAYLRKHDAYAGSVVPVGEPHLDAIRARRA